MDGGSWASKAPSPAPTGCGVAHSPPTKRPGLSSPAGSNSVLIRDMIANISGCMVPHTSHRLLSSIGAALDDQAAAFRLERLPERQHQRPSATRAGVEARPRPRAAARRARAARGASPRRRRGPPPRAPRPPSGAGAGARRPRAARAAPSTAAPRPAQAASGTSSLRPPCPAASCDQGLALVRHRLGRAADREQQPDRVAPPARPAAGPRRRAAPRDRAGAASRAGAARNALAASREGKPSRHEREAGGIGCRRSVTSTSTPRVPSEPTRSFGTS